MTIKNYYETIKSRCVEDPVTGCWNWTRATHVQGYGFMRHGKKMKTIQRIMATEHLKWDCDFRTRIGTSCDNKLCANPDHIIAQTHSEVNYIRYKKHGTGGKFDGIETQVRDEYNEMKKNKVPRTINILAEKYGISPAVVYRAIDKANGK
jgi:hypothetical protein